MAAKQKQFKKENYNDVCDFLMKHTAEDKSQINWNWARWEWMYFHPEFDQELMGAIGLWYDQEELVAIATYDMYNGESAFVVADGHVYLEDEIIAYSLQTFSDEAGLGIAVNENHLETIHKLEAAGFVQHENTENVLVKNLDTADYTYTLAKNFHCANINGLDDVVNYTEVLWKGMDHEGEVPVDEATIKECYQRNIAIIIFMYMLLRENNGSLFVVVGTYQERTMLMLNRFVPYPNSVTKD